MKKYKELLSNVAYFFIASFIPKTITFFMVPLYTYCLSTSDYGVADLITTTVSLIMPVFTLQIQDAVLKFSINNKEERKDIFSIGFNIVNNGAAILLLIILIISVLGIFNVPWWYYVFILLYFYSGSLNNIFSYFCRGIDRVRSLTFASIATTVVTVALNLLTLLVLRWGLTGYLISNISGIMAGNVILFFSAKLYSYILPHRIKKSLNDDLIVFSLPMIVSALSWWVNNASDKYILSLFCTTSIVGVYAVASKIPAILKIFGDVISKAFSISAIKEFNTDDDGFIGKSYSAISMFSVIGCSVLILLNIYIAKILYANEFFIAWKYVPFLLISVVFNIVSMNCENIFMAIGDTKIISKTALASAGVNTIFNFALIPSFGAFGAAIATMIGYCFIWVYRYLSMKKIVQINNNIVKETTSYCLLLVEAILAYFGKRLMVFELLTIMAIIGLYSREIFSYVKNIKNLRGDKV